MKKKELEKNITQIMDILITHYNPYERTTLNRMRIIDGKRTDNFGFTEPFKILISCLLSLRARDETTDVISKELFKIATTPQEILKIPNEKLEKLIFKTGHYKRKTMILKSVSSELIEKFNSQVPDTKEELLSIKYIGPKTANIVLNFAYGKPVLPIDTHCHRVPNRLGWIKTKTPEKTETELEKILPLKYWFDFNAIFVLFGREICTPISPFCSRCMIKKHCKKVNVLSSR